MCVVKPLAALLPKRRPAALNGVLPGGPDAVEVGGRSLTVGGEHTATLVVTGYPRTVGPGWLAPLVDGELPLEISLHVYPLESGEMVRTLTHKLVQLHSSRLFEARGGRLADPNSDDPGVLGMRRFTELLGAAADVTATAVQTVGQKGWDGFALALVEEPGAAGSR